MAVGAYTEPPDFTDPGLAAAGKNSAINGTPTGGNGSPRVPYNADTRPVIVGVTPHMVSDAIQGAGRVYSPVQGMYDGIPMSVYEAQQALIDWKMNDHNRFSLAVDLLRGAGYLGPKSNSMEAIQTAWKDALQGAASLYENYQTANSDIFRNLYNLAAENADQGGGSRSGGSTPITDRTYTSSDVTLTNPTRAKSIVNSALSQYLGRDAKPGELKAFLASLHEEQQENPLVSTTHTHMSTSGSSASQTDSRQTSGGVDEAQFAEDWARSQEGAAEHTTANKYLGVLMKAIQNPQGVL